MVVRLGCVVEGHGDAKAVPVLIRRIKDEACPELGVEILEPFRKSVNKLRKPTELENVVETVGRQVGTPGGILVLIDADDEQPGCLAPKLLERVRSARPDIPSTVVLAKFEYEAWFLGGANSLAGKHGLPASLTPPADPEAIRGAKEWLTRHMGTGRAYSETRHQAKLTGSLDLQAARSAKSFDKCYREIVWLLRAVRDRCGK